ncbi:MAG: M15 family metallopeptidase [Eubacteriales bacterium]|nr:M15 family metallopeptidase [Eubacteriales bacterium]
MKKVFLILLLLLMWTSVVSASFPAWEFPLDARIVEDKTGLLVLTNKNSLIDADYVPTRLKEINLRATNRGMELREEAAEALSNMFNSASQDGITLYVKSAYRSYQTQSTMYYNRLKKYGKDDGVVAYPGSSDHQTGLACDILNYEWTQQDGMRPEFSLTNEAKWLAENCADFGFILRYPEDKQDITGIIFEPWHFRFVGVEAAKYITENALTLEEFHMQAQNAVSEFEAQGGDFTAYCDSLRALPPPVDLGEGDQGDSEVSLFYKVP